MFISKNSFKKLAILIIILFPLTLFAHNKTLTGVVSIKNDQSLPVIGAVVRLENTVLGNITDKNGRFVIKKIPDGKYNVIISCVGMKTIIQQVVFEHIQGDELELNLQMEESPVMGENIVVTATRSDKIYEDVPVKVSTITESNLNSTASTNMREGLQYQPGVRTETDCQNCGYSQVRINGLEGKYSQILIDGKPIFSALNGVYGLDQIPSNMVERVEVIRGGGSSLYGGNAVAGVINIITKEPCSNNFSLAYDNFFTENKIPEQVINLNASVVNDNQDMGATFFGMMNHRNEFDANNDGFTEIGRLDVKTFGFKSFWKIHPTTKLSMEYHTIYHEMRGGNKLDLPPHEADISEGATNKTDLAQLNFLHYFKNSMELNAFCSFQKTKRNSYYGANQDLNAYGFTRNSTYSGGMNLNKIVNGFFGTHILTAGYSFDYDAIHDEAPAYDRIMNQVVNTNGIYCQDDWSISKSFSALYGLRIDKHNMIDNLIFNPRMSLLYKAFDNLSFRGTFSTGYRAPQAFDEDLHVSIVNGEGILIKLANGLLPEYSTSFSFSGDYSLKFGELPVAFSLEYFNTNLKDAFVLVDIGNDSKGNRILERRNSDGAIVKGITAEIQSTLRKDFDIKLGATFQSSLNKSNIEWSSGDSIMNIPSKYSNEIFRSPNIYGYFLATYHAFENFYVDINGIYTGKMFVPHYKGYISQDVLVQSNPFFELNAKVSYSLKKSPNIELSLGVMNIFNSYQKDFDIGINRDAGYIYGPSRPLTTMFSIKIEA